METQSSSNFNLIAISRQDSFLVYLRSAGLNLTRVAEELGVSVSAVSQIYRARSISTRRWRQLRELGIPAEVLPPAVDRRSGPAPKSRN